MCKKNLIVEPKTQHCYYKNWKSL
ncbi:hypothetical protein Gotur_033351 [Gossypium turneri]